MSHAGSSNSHKGKGRATDQDATVEPPPRSLLSNNRTLPRQDDSYIPPAAQLKKYLYAKPHMMLKHSNPKKNKDKKLGHHLAHLTSTAQNLAESNYEHDQLLLLNNNSQSNQGLIEVENDLERTWKVTQQEIVENSSVATKGKQFSLNLEEFGPYSIDYTRNGRHLALAGRKGHVATFDWQSGRLHSELQLGETVRSIKWLHDESFYAVAQKKYVYIYDKDGLEVHQLRQHLEVNQMEFLPYHFLLATVGNPGYLKYHDTSIGQLVAEHRTKLGSCNVMAQNHHNGFIHLGHQNGTVTLWSPSVSQAQIKLLAHTSPISSISLDPSTMGHRMVTTSLDGSVKIWDTRKWQVLNEYSFKKTPTSSQWSQKGLLGIGWGNHISVFNDLSKNFSSNRVPPPPYLTHTFPSTPVHSIKFTPFEDLLGVGHSKGFDSLIVPGSGESNYDSLELDPFEGKRKRREREVHMLLDKLPFDLITLDENVLGKVDKKILNAKEDENVHKPGYKELAFGKKTRIDRLKETGKAELAEDESSDEDDDEEDEEDLDGKLRQERVEKRLKKSDDKKRMRGKSSGIKKALRKRRRNVIDPQTVALKEKLERNRQKAKQAKQNALAAKSASSGTASALDRFGF